ncbi:transcription factor bHLH [Forsythia ovata]|uniref:Transcription factor bHLH n=1 Tax=Forsythia ovata TaxID=205694 RepID=A0ABD1P3Y7_9LAMI
MESANIHQLQNHLVGSSSLAIPCCYGVGSTPNTILNPNSYSDGAILNPRQESVNPCSSVNVSMIPDLGFHWANATTDQIITGESAPRIKEEFFNNIYSNKYTKILNSQQSRDFPLNDLNAKLLLRTSSYGNLTNGIQLSSGDLFSNSLTAGSERGFNRGVPSINVSYLNQSVANSANSSSSDMDLEVLNVLTSSRFSGNFSPSSKNQLGLFRDGLSYYDFDHVQRSNKMPFHSINMVSALSNGAALPKRSTTIKEGKAVETVKPRLESRVACQPPFKVRKEKLGDRIAALQQLVAPFGKTDTASVLMEVIGYIKFLQSQVENLSVPYMKSTRNKTIVREMEGELAAENENEDLKRDLTSRGLCLVPLSCFSYVTDGGGGAVWPPPHYGGAT